MLYKEITLYDMLSDERLNTRYTYDAIEQIYEDLTCDSGVSIEYDAVAIYCDYRELSPSEIHEEYSNIDSIGNAKDTDELIERLNYYTIARELKNGMILFIAF